VVDTGSLTQAASLLDVPRPTVSKRLARLEERLGVRLLHRTTRRLTLTEQGKVLYPKARQVVQAAQEAVTAVARLDGVPRGLLRVLVPAGIPEAVFSGWMVGFLDAHPEVQLDVVATEEHVDLVAEGFDVAMRYGQMQDTSLVAKTLAMNADIAVASPHYLAKHGTPKTADDLVEHECIVGYRGRNAPHPHWPLLDGGSVRVGGRFASNHVMLGLHAALRHQGIALVVNASAAAFIAKGELVQVLPDVIGRPDRVALVYPDREFLDPKVRAFVDFLVSQLQQRRAEAPADAG